MWRPNFVSLFFRPSHLVYAEPPVPVLVRPPEGLYERLPLVAVPDLALGEEDDGAHAVAAVHGPRSTGEGLRMWTRRRGGPNGPTGQGGGGGGFASLEEEEERGRERERAEGRGAREKNGPWYEGRGRQGEGGARPGHRYAERREPKGERRPR